MRVARVVVGTAVGAAIGLAWLLGGDDGREGGERIGRDAPVVATEAPRLAGADRASTRADATSPTETARTPAPAARESDVVASPPAAEPVVVLELRVGLATGGAPARARVLIGDEDEANPRVGRPWTPEAPRVEVPAGATRIRVAGGRFGEWSAEDVEVRGRDAPRFASATLEPRAMIVGHVQPAPGDAWMDVTVRCERLDRPPGDGEEHEEHADERNVRERDGTDGWFRFDLEHDELRPARYRVSAAPWLHGPMSVSRVVVVDRLPVEVELLLPPRDRSQGVLVRVEGPDGAPLIPIGIQVDVEDVEGSGGSGGAAFERVEDGLYWVPTRLPRFSGRDPARVTLNVYAKDLGRRSVVLDATRPNEPTRVAFVAPGTVRAMVEGRLPDPAAGRLSLVVPGRGASSTAVARGHVQPDGTFAFDPVQPGVYRLAWSTRTATWNGQADLGPVEIRSGTQDVSVRVPSAEPLRLRSRIASGWIGIRSVDGAVTVWTSGPPKDVGADGRWSLDAPLLPSGEYETIGSVPNRRFRVPDTSEIVLDD